MAITKVTRTLLSTGIVDNSNATAITIDSSENVGIGTSSPTSALDVTGTATMDGLTVDGSAGFGVTAPSISEGYQIHTDTVGNGVWGGFGNVYLTSNYKFNSTNKFAGTGYAQLLEAVPSSGAFTFKTSSASGTADATATMQNRLNIATTGDISFYDDTGTSQALFWDASAERLGIGTTSPSANLHIGNTGGAAELWLQRTDGYNAVKLYGSTLGDGQGFKINVNNGDRFAIDSSGNVGIGTDSPSGVLHLRDTTPHLYIQSDDGQSSKLLFGDAADNSRGGFEYTSSDAMIFMTNNLSEKMRIDSSGNVGIGTSSPSATLHVASSSAKIAEFERIGNQVFDLTISDIGEGAGQLWFNAQTNDTGFNFRPKSSGGTNTNALYIAPDGDIGIGTSSPTDSYNYGKTLDIHGSTGAVTYLRDSDATSNFGFLAYDGGTTNRCVIGGGGAAYLRFISAGAECGRFDNEGNFLIGKTTHNVNNTQGVDITTEGAVVATNDGGVSFLANRTGSDGQTFLFRRQNVTVGSISVTGSATTYATSSDYRLKENVDYDFTALDRVAQLKPARFNFIATPTVTVDGFVAHEVQDIVPEAIIGEKDAVDDEGNPEYQGIDQSKLVPLLTKAIQELSDKVDNQQTIIDDLKTRIETLENA
jgi:hypothetical protein